MNQATLSVPQFTTVTSSSSNSAFVPSVPVTLTDKIQPVTKIHTVTMVILSIYVPFNNF